MTTAEIDGISSPASGILTYDTTVGRYRLRLPTEWQYLSSGIVTGQYNHQLSQKPGVTTPVDLNFNEIDIVQEGIAHSKTVNPEQFKALIKKTITWALAPQWERTTTGGTRTIDFFIMLSTDGGTTFTNITNSNVKAKAGSNDSNVIPLIATVTMNKDDIIKFQMRISATGDGLGTVFTAIETGPPEIPATPAQILTCWSGD